jgi:pilus assembly protein CpaD
MLLIKESLMKTRNRTLIKIIGATLSAATLAACSTPTASTGPSIFNNKIQVAESIERLELYTRPNGLELSARDQAAVNLFLQSYRQRGNGPIYLNVPSASASGLGAQQAQALIRQNLAVMGLGGAAMQTGQYQSANGSPAPVVVSYRTLKTMPRDCRQLGNATDTFSNQPYDNFGCFHASNLAAMIGDPRQLLEPYDMTIPDSQRRQTVYDKYIQGENPASTQPDRQQVAVD